MCFRVIIFIFLLGMYCVSPVFAASCKLESLSGIEKKQLNETFSDLYFSLASRPTISFAEGLPELADAAKLAAKDTTCFLGNNGQDENLIVYANKIKTILESFKSDYSAAPEGLLGAELRGAAVSNLHDAIFISAEQAGLPLELLNFAFDKGLARFESKLTTEEAMTSLSLEQKELIDLLLIDASLQFSFNSWIKGDSQAKRLLEVDPSLILSDDALQLAYDMMLATSVSLEEDLSDPLLTADAQSLIQAQFNQEARHDLVLMRILLEMYYLQQSRDKETILLTLASRMNSVGGLMADITPEQIEASGINFTGLVYDWVKPEQLLTYLVATELPEQIMSIGGIVPQPPSFDYYADPYLAFIRFEYDMTLADELFKIEENLLIEDVISTSMAPLSMQERFLLHDADRQRRLDILKRLNGANPQEKDALLMLLTPPFI